MTAERPRTDACANCGAEYFDAVQWECGTTPIIDGDTHRSPLCKEREARQKAEAEVERLKKMVIEAAEIGDKRSENFKARAEKAETALIKINEELCHAGLREYGN